MIHNKDTSSTMKNSKASLRKIKNGLYEGIHPNGQTWSLERKKPKKWEGKVDHVCTAPAPSRDELRQRIEALYGDF